MSEYHPKLGITLWLGAVPLLLWGGLGGPAWAVGAGALSTLVGGLLSVQWMMAGGMPRMRVR
jgi:hypothetical protein